MLAHQLKLEYEPWFQNYEQSINVFLHDAIRYDSWETVKWLLCTEISLERPLVMFCVVMDKLELLDKCTQFELAGLFTVKCVRWMWMLQHRLAHLIHWASVSVKYATIVKLDLLKDIGVILPEAATEEAALHCNIDIFWKVISMARSWQPVRCMRISKLNFDHRIRLSILRFLSSNSNMQKHTRLRNVKRCRKHNGQSTCS